MKIWLTNLLSHFKSHGMKTDQLLSYLQIQLSYFGILQKLLLLRFRFSHLRTTQHSYSSKDNQR